MKKLLTVLLFVPFAIFAQGLTIDHSLPKIAPPSPTVAGFMKFEEVPVNNYTGTPDISIPLYSIETLSKDLQLNLSLKYHPSSINTSEVASFVGLGWSLFAGGTISRTVRGLPDEWNANGKFGIYNYSGPLGYEYETLMATGVTLTADQYEKKNMLLYDTYVQGKYDTEYDLYQYNFHGHTGRFYLKKVNGTLAVVKLDNDNAVNISYDATGNAFTILDEKGLKYKFDVKETTNQSSINSSKHFDPAILTVPSSGFAFNFTSAFHLSEVRDRSNNVLVNYEFFSQEINESTHYVTTTIAYSPDVDAQIPGLKTIGYGDDQLSKFDPQESRQATTNVTSTKKIKQISIRRKAKIELVLADDRQDSENAGNHRLKEIIIKSYDTIPVVIKKYVLEHNYAAHDFLSDSYEIKRLLLNKVVEKNKSNTVLNSYTLEYENTVIGETLTKDYWGYFNKKLTGYPESTHRETTPSVCTTDVLQKIILPTGGAMIFDYESNRYSFQGSEPIANFDSNPENWNYTGENIEIEGNDEYQIPTSSGTRYVRLMPRVIAGQSGIFHLINTGTGDTLSSFSCGFNNNQCSVTPPITLLAFLEYKIKYTVLNVSPGQHTGGVSLYFETRMNPQKQYLYGGGIRIKTIGYFEDGTVNKDYYKDTMLQTGYTPSKQKNYAYHLYGDVLKSSGSLVYPKPVFESGSIAEHSLELWNGPIIIRIDLIVAQYKKFTEFNNLLAVKTAGSDVGYQHVTVRETGSGRSEYEYTSAIEYPQTSQGLAARIVPEVNIDYKRGLLKKERHYNELGSKVTETLYDYQIDEPTSLETTGVKVFMPGTCAYFFKYPTSTHYLDKIEDCNNVFDIPTCYYLCGEPMDLFSIGYVHEGFGWPKLSEKTIKEYFDNGVVQSKEFFTYNATNKHLASHKIERYNSGGTVDETTINYTYTNYLNNNITSILEVETLKNGSVTGKQSLLYNPQQFLQSVDVSKNGFATETRLFYNAYDAWGHPLEVQQAGGQKIYYIWGYYHAYPVAMIEGVTYASITPQLITDIQNATVTGMESALNALRSHLNSNQPGARLTTYLYDPLVGVTEVKDPNGFKTTYHYDAFNRLEYVKDHNGNRLSENKYNYRP
ncbi:MAG: RHS repeat domain-containing protein [Flavobacterium sp.]